MRRHLRWMFTIALVYSFAGEGLAQKKNFWKGVVAYFDSSNVKGVDPAYITQPQKPWALVLNSNIDQMNLEVSSTIDGDFTTHMQIKPPVSTSVGLWAGYRGWGAGYSLSLSGNNGYSFAMNMVSPSYGLNLRINRFKFDKPNASFSASSHDGGSQSGEFDEEFLNAFLSSPMKIGMLSFDGYWVFNKKRFSLLAAYDQSTTQLRSAGSLIAGLMYYYQKLDYDSPKNFYFIKNAGDVGLMRVYQGSVGFGYTYNWVPVRGLVLNVVAMPVLTLINKVKSSRYEIILPDEGEYDSWDADSYLNAITMRPAGEETLNGGVRLNFDVRMAASYCWRDWYVGATGQVHHFRSNNNNTTLKQTDWTVKAFIGMRL